MVSSNYHFTSSLHIQSDYVKALLLLCACLCMCVSVFADKRIQESHSNMQVGRIVRKLKYLKLEPLQSIHQSKETRNKCSMETKFKCSAIHWNSKRLVSWRFHFLGINIFRCMTWWIAKITSSITSCRLWFGKIDFIVDIWDDAILSLPYLD